MPKVLRKYSCYRGLEHIYTKTPASDRYRYDGNRSRLPYGHAMRIEQNRKPETAFFFRNTRDTAISASACSYNHITSALDAATKNSFKYVYDPDTGMSGVPWA